MTARVLITGVDVKGRSCVAHTGPIDLVMPPGMDGFRTAEIFYAPSLFTVAGLRGGVGAKYDLHLAPGAIRWLIVEYAAETEFEMHHTDSVDFDMVVSGEIELILGDGAHALRPGDCAVIDGVDHAWRAGRQGCRLVVLTIGAAPPI